MINPEFLAEIQGLIVKEPIEKVTTRSQQREKKIIFLSYLDKMDYIQTYYVLLF